MFHRVYWTGWISHHNRIKRRLLTTGSPRSIARGLILPGFASVYREGFEIVLFLQNMGISYGEDVILPGVVLAAALVALVATVAFLVGETGTDGDRARTITSGVARAAEPGEDVTPLGQVPVAEGGSSHERMRGP